MAASPGIGPSNSKTKSLKDLQTALYTGCCTTFPSDKLLFQQDLLSLKIIPDDNVDHLIKVVQGLTSANLFSLHTVNERICWKLIKEEDAAKYKSLTPDEKMVYRVIDSSSTNGIWVKHIKLRTNLHQTVVTRCLKSLEAKALVKTIRNVKHPSQKIYMVFGLQPNEDVTGGAWFTDGVLDEELIEQLGEFVVRWVASKSWAAVTERAQESAVAESDVATGKKRKLLDPGMIDTKGKGKETDGGVKRHQSGKSKATTTYLPYPPGYKCYPTLSEITTAINDSGAFDVQLTKTRTQQLVDVLCFDGHLVKVNNGKAYKSVKTPARVLKADADGQNALTEAPCGVCPVFELCEEGGPINARNCEYFQAWLEF